ncbi:peroxidase-related enzyme [Methylobacterium sp. J-030]|uniref:peroxidase-related enzyme n=1 Tax=Methylobacterium sp. J-030 TaxID=2836627 RepID=UPI001FB87487|nr:peroxidase-related enzyme [Methylobacterium sp. J-030]MCJ2069475.1 peroxidase-related enzyme [Methylobacterium sp. J-030]
MGNGNDGRSAPPPALAVEDLPPDIRTRISAAEEKLGFVPNVFLMLAHRPAEFRAFMAYHDTLMDKDGGLTKAEREMIVVATSAANQCQYCVVAHGAILRIRARDAFIADQVATNYRKADISARQRAMLDFALTVSQQAHTVGEPDKAALRAHGFDADDIWDIAAIAAFFGLSNRLANVADLRPNTAFYGMGRDFGRAREAP